MELAPPLTSFIAVAYLGQAAASEELLARLAVGGSAVAAEPARGRRRELLPDSRHAPHVAGAGRDRACAAFEQP